MGMKGKFITFEGPEGSGKSTQIQLLKRYLKRKGRRVMVLREPGGVKISEAVRRVLLDVKNDKMTDLCETLLYMAARAQIVEEVLRPALKKGMIVLCDRFLDSTVAYQGYGNGVDRALIMDLGKLVTQKLSPDLTFLFDLPVNRGLSRRKRAKDRIEHRPLNYHNRVRNGYLAIARREPRRMKVLKAERSREEIQKEIRQYVDVLLK
jgi:dTMP kinase